MSTKFQSAAPSGCGDMLFLDSKWVEHALHCEFLFDFFNSFFNLICYSYAMRVQNFKRRHQVVVEIYFFWVVYGLNMYCTMSFNSISLVFFCFLKKIALL